MPQPPQPTPEEQTRLNAELIRAAKTDFYPDMVERLIKDGAQVNAKDSGGFSALHRAAQQLGSSRIIKALISNGADVNAKVESYGKTPLHFAAESGSADAIKLLAENKANVNTADENRGEKPLHYAVRKNHIDAVKMLLEKGADINGDDLNKESPLHGVKTLEMAKLLIEKKADINAKSDRNYTPLHSIVLSPEKDTAQIAKLLLDMGADVNSKADGGHAILHSAAYRGDRKVVDALLAKKELDILAKNENGKTALDVAREQGNDIVARDIEAEIAKRGKEPEKDHNVKQSPAVPPAFTEAVAQYVAGAAGDAVAHSPHGISFGKGLQSKQSL